MTGTIKRLNLERGFGFLSSAELDQDCFFHCKSLQPPLSFDEQLEGQTVLFELVKNERGPRAENIRVAY